MWVEQPQIHPMVRPALAEIQSAGVEITPEIVVWVQHAANAIRKTPERAVEEIIDWPVPCGGALLYPLSFGAREWLTALPENVRNDIRVIAYACAHSKRPDVLRPLRYAVSAMAAARIWAWRLTCSRGALEASVDMVLGAEHYVEVKETVARKRDAGSTHWGAAVRAACTKYPGTTPEYWTWQSSVAQLYDAIAMANEDLPPNIQVTGYEVESNIAFRSIVEHIKATLKKEPAANV